MRDVNAAMSSCVNVRSSVCAIPLGVCLAAGGMAQYGRCVDGDDGNGGRLKSLKHTSGSCCTSVGAIERV